MFHVFHDGETDLGDTSIAQPFGAGGEISGDDVTTTGMTDPLADILSLKRDNYRLKGKDLSAHPTGSAKVI